MNFDFEQEGDGGGDGSGDIDNEDAPIWQQQPLVNSRDRSWVRGRPCIWGSGFLNMVR